MKAPKVALKRWGQLGVHQDLRIGKELGLRGRHSTTGAASGRQKSSLTDAIVQWLQCTDYTCKRIQLTAAEWEGRFQPGTSYRNRGRSTNNEGS